LDQAGRPGRARRSRPGHRPRRRSLALKLRRRPASAYDGSICVRQQHPGVGGYHPPMILFLKAGDSKVGDPSPYPKFNHSRGYGHTGTSRAPPGASFPRRYRTRNLRFFDPAYESLRYSGDPISISPSSSPLNRGGLFTQRREARRVTHAGVQPAGWRGRSVRVSRPGPAPGPAPPAPLEDAGWGDRGVCRHAVHARVCVRVFVQLSIPSSCVRAPVCARGWVGGSLASPKGARREDRDVRMAAAP
jgi:hypothetical protein